VNRWIAPGVVPDHPTYVAHVQEALAAPGDPTDQENTGKAQPDGKSTATTGTPENTKDSSSANQEDAPGILSEKWAEIREKKQELARKEEELRQLEKTLNEKLAQEKKIQDSIRKMLDEADVLKDKQIKHLIDVYSNMKAKQAALVLESLEEDIAVKILSGMRGRKAGEILSYVSPKKAALLSERLTDLRIPFAD